MRQYIQGDTILPPRHQISIEDAENVVTMALYNECRNYEMAAEFADDSERDRLLIDHLAGATHLRDALAALTDSTEHAAEEMRAAWMRARRDTHGD